MIHLPTFGANWRISHRAQNTSPAKVSTGALLQLVLSPGENNRITTLPLVLEGLKYEGLNGCPRAYLVWLPIDPTLIDLRLRTISECQLLPKLFVCEKVILAESLSRTKGEDLLHLR